MKSQGELPNRMRWLCGALTGMIALALTACAHSKQPASGPGAMTSQGSGRGVAGESAGVRVVARVRTWNGDPPTLSQYVVPIWIQIENRSGKALWLGYSGLYMEDPNDSQARLPAVPPGSVKGKATIPGSAVPPEFGPEDLWMGTWLEPGFDDHLASTIYWQEDMPTREMLRRAIREGVLANGRKVAGFVYFPRTKQDPAALTLRTELVDATNKQAFGRIDIPLAVKE